MHRENGALAVGWLLVGKVGGGEANHSFPRRCFLNLCWSRFRHGHGRRPRVPVVRVPVGISRVPVGISRVPVEGFYPACSG